MMPQIAPNFGLHRDYDEFLLGTAPGLLASIAAIYGGHLDGRAYLAGLIHAILQEINKKHRRFTFYSAAWLLHMSAPLPDGQIFEFARTCINEGGGMQRACLLLPPLQVPMPLDCAPEEFSWGVDMVKDPELVPARAEFLSRVKSAHPPRGVDEPLALAVRLLTEECDLDSLVPVAVALLAQAS